MSVEQDSDFYKDLQETQDSLNSNHANEVNRTVDRMYDVAKGFADFDLTGVQPDIERATVTDNRGHDALGDVLKSEEKVGYPVVDGRKPRATVLNEVHKSDHRRVAEKVKATVRIEDKKAVPGLGKGIPLANKRELSTATVSVDSELGSYPHIKEELKFGDTKVTRRVVEEGGGFRVEQKTTVGGEERRTTTFRAKNVPIGIPRKEVLPDMPPAPDRKVRSRVAPKESVFFDQRKAINVANRILTNVKETASKYPSDSAKEVVERRVKRAEQIAEAKRVSRKQKESNTN